MNRPIIREDRPKEATMGDKPKAGGKATTGEELKDTNVHDLDEKALDTLEIDEEGIIRQRDPDAGSEGEGSKGQGITDAKPEKSEGETPATGTTKPEEEGDEKAGDPLKDTQRAFHSERKARLKAEQELAEARKQLREATAPKEPVKLTEEEVEDLKDTDPDAYFEYLENHNQFKRQKEDYEQKVQTEVEAEKNLALAQAYEATVDSFMQFAREAKGLSVAPGKKWAEQPEELRNYYDSPEFQKIIEAVEKNPKRYYEEDGSISFDTLRMVYRDLFFEDIAKGERINGRNEATNTIRRAAQGGSKLGMVPKETAGKGSTAGKAFDKLSYEEIQDLSPEEVSRYLEEAEKSQPEQ